MTTTTHSAIAARNVDAAMALARAYLASHADGPSDTERDAERYRYIRVHKFERYGNGQEHVLYFPPGHVVADFDTVIDAAIRQAMGGGE